MQLSQNAQQLPARNMKQRGIGEYPVEMLRREIEIQEILFPDRTSSVSSCHLDEVRGSVQPYGQMAEAGKGLEIPAWATAEVENREGRLATEVAQQRGDVLTHVVVARALAKVFGTLLVMGERLGSDLFWSGVG